MATPCLRLIITRKFIKNSLNISGLYFQPIVLQSSRTIMTTSVRAKKLLETLKDNPYFDKYAGAITKLQQTNPEEFISRIEEKEKQQKMKGKVNLKKRHQ